MHVEARGQHHVGSLLQPCGTWEKNASHQAWWQVHHWLSCLAGPVLEILSVPSQLSTCWYNTCAMFMQFWIKPKASCMLGENSTDWITTPDPPFLFNVSFIFFFTSFPITQSKIFILSTEINSHFPASISLFYSITFGSLHKLTQTLNKSPHLLLEPGCVLSWLIPYCINLPFWACALLWETFFFTI